MVILIWLQHMLTYLTSCLSVVMKNEGIISISKTLDILKQALTIRGVTRRQDRAAVFRALTPPGLLSKVQEIITFSVCGTW